MDAKTTADDDVDRPPTLPPPLPELTPDIEPAGPLGLPRRRRGFELSPINIRRWRNFKANRRGYWSLWIFLVLFVVTLFAEFIANDKPLFIHFDGKSLLSGVLHLSGHRLRRRSRHRRRLPRSVPAEVSRRAPRHRDLAADPVLLQDHQRQSAVGVSVEADLDAEPEGLRFRRQERLWQMRHARIQLARHRRSGPRRAGAPDLRLPHFGAVRPGADHRVVDHRRRGRRGAGLFRRLDRSVVPALHRNLDLGAGALSAADHFLGAGAGLLRAARHPVVVLLGAAGRPGARRISARPQFRIYPGGARARRLQHESSCSATCCRTPWWRR